MVDLGVDHHFRKPLYCRVWGLVATGRCSATGTGLLNEWELTPHADKKWLCKVIGNLRINEMDCILTGIPASDSGWLLQRVASTRLSFYYDGPQTWRCPCNGPLWPATLAIMPGSWPSLDHVWMYGSTGECHLKRWWIDSTKDPVVLATPRPQEHVVATLDIPAVLALAVEENFMLQLGLFFGCLSQQCDENPALGFPNWLVVWNIFYFPIYWE